MMGGRGIALACLATAIVAGCAKLPEYREDAVSTADIVLNIKCELREAAWSDPRNQWVQTWNAGLILSLEVTHLGGIDSDNTWVFPLNQGATFILGLTGGFSGQATRTERVNFKEKLTDLHNDKQLMCEREDPGRYAHLGGRLGIDDLFARVGQMQKDARIDPKQLDYNLDFIVKKNASTTPKFNLIPIGKEKTFTGSLKWTGSRGDTHSLKITLEPPDRPGPGCPVPLSFGKCPIPVYTVTLPPEPKAALRSGARRAAPRASGGISPAESDSLDRAQSRNLLQSIDDQLRRQGIGN